MATPTLSRPRSLAGDQDFAPSSLLPDLHAEWNARTAEPGWLAWDMMPTGGAAPAPLAPDAAPPATAPAEPAATAIPPPDAIPIRTAEPESDPSGSDDAGSDAALPPTAAGSEDLASPPDDAVSAETEAALAELAAALEALRDALEQLGPPPPGYALPELPTLPDLSELSPLG